MKKKSEEIEGIPGFPKIESGYRVPDGYFESFGERLKLRMDADRPVSSGRNGIVFYLKPLLGLAAGLAIILTVYLYSADQQPEVSFVNLQQDSALIVGDRSETYSATLTSQISEVSFFSAIAEMDEFDASKMPKEELADYLASNCSDLEILYANK
jgi:hypothetical protein